MRSVQGGLLLIWVEQEDVLFQKERQGLCGQQHCQQMDQQVDFSGMGTEFPGEFGRKGKYLLYLNCRVLFLYHGPILRKLTPGAK